MSNQLQPHQSVKSMLADDRVKAQVAAALPPHMDAGRVMRIAMSAVSTNPTLAKCTPNSVGIALIKAAETGLECNGVEAALVPFKKKGVYECQFMPMYQGLVKLAYQSELVTEMHAEVVREGDFFEWCKGTDSYLRWRPKEDGEGQRKMTHAWASAKIKGGGTPFVVMTREEVMAHKACSQGAGSDFSPWNSPMTEPAMWKKTAVRELCKMLPRSSALTQVLLHETAHEIGGDVIEGVLIQPSITEEVEEETKADALAKRIGGKKKPKDFFEESVEFIRACENIEELDKVFGHICQDKRSAEWTQEQQEKINEVMLSKQSDLEA